jgi:carbon monoxide dehydrogenase subunit G
MDFNGTFELNTSMDNIYRFVMDPEKLASCIPGLKKMEKISDTEFTVLVKVGIAFIKEDFNIKFTVLESEPPSHAKLAGVGAGKSGTVDITADMHLTENNGKSTMLWTAQANVGGKIGSMGQRLITGQAEKIINQMFKGIKEALEPN